MKVELKSYKAAGGEETPRFEAALYIDGIKAAIVSNGGTGGCHRYFWTDPSFRAKFTIYAKEQKPDEMEKEDAVVYDLIDEIEERKFLKRHCAKKTLFRVAGKTYKKGQWDCYKVPFTPESKRKVTEEFGALGTVEFANEKF